MFKNNYYLVEKCIFLNYKIGKNCTLLQRFFLTCVLTFRDYIITNILSTCVFTFRDCTSLQIFYQPVCSHSEIAHYYKHFINLCVHIQRLYTIKNILSTCVFTFRDCTLLQTFNQPVCSHSQPFKRRTKRTF